MDKPATNVDALVLSTIAKVCNRAQRDVTPATTLQSLGIDSLAMPAVVTRLEALFECEFSHEQTLDFLQAVYVEDIATLVRSSVAATALA